MKLIVKELLETGTPYKPEGKDYTIYEWIVSGTIDGEDRKLMTLKSFSNLTVQSGAEYNVEQKEWKGKISYTVSKESKPFQKSGWSKPIYTLEEYDNLFNHAFKFITSKVSDQALANPLISTYIISAIQSNVKLSTEVKGITGAEMKLYDDAAKKINALMEDRIINEFDLNTKLREYNIKKINELTIDELTRFMSELQN